MDPHTEVYGEQKLEFMSYQIKKKKKKKTQVCVRDEGRFERGQEEELG